MSRDYGQFDVSAVSLNYNISERFDRIRWVIELENGR